MKSIFGILSLIAIFTLTVTETVKASVETTAVIEVGIHAPVPVILVDVVVPSVTFDFEHSVTVIEIDSVAPVLVEHSVTPLSRDIYKVNVDKVTATIDEPDPLGRKDLSYNIDTEPVTIETDNDTGGVIDNIVDVTYRS